MPGFIYHSTGASYIKISCAVLGLAHFCLVGAVLLCYEIESLKTVAASPGVDP